MHSGQSVGIKKTTCRSCIQILTVEVILLLLLFLLFHGSCSWDDVYCVVSVVVYNCVTYGLFEVVMETVVMVKVLWW